MNLDDDAALADGVLDVISGALQAARADPAPLSAAELQNASPGRLLSMRVRRHPAVMVVEAAGLDHAALVALYPGLAGSDGILLSLRGGLIEALSLTADELAMFRELDSPRNLFSLLTGVRTDRSSAAEFHRLVKLGVVVEVKP